MPWQRKFAYKVPSYSTTAEIFPDSFDAIQKDRVGDAHGGVFIALRCDLLCTETPELDIKCEVI